MTHHEHERDGPHETVPKLVDPVRGRWIITGACWSRCSS